MANFLKRQTLWGLIPTIITVITLFFVASCNNLVRVQQGNLTITVPGSRAASGASFIVELTSSSGTSQSQTVASGQTVTFEELAPDTYTIEVEGKETDKVVYYGTSTAIVTAGASASATVNLVSVVSTFEDLQKAVEETGGAVAVYGNITVTSGLTVSKEVTLVGVGEGATITNATDTTPPSPLFTVNSGTLTLGDGINSLTLNGGGVKSNVVNIPSGRTVTMKDNVTIKNATSSSVNVEGTFNMVGGKITSNNVGTDHGGGVYVQTSGIFNMTGGEISDNTAEKGDQVYVASVDANKGTFKMGGSATLNGGEVHLDNSKTAVSITLTSSLTSGSATKPVATIKVENYSSNTTVLTDDSSGSLVSSESSKFAVTPDSTTNYTINSSGELEKITEVTSFSDLQNAITAGGTIKISNDITVTYGLTVSNTVTLVAASDGVTLTNNSSGSLFTVKTDVSDAKLTLGDGKNSLILDGNSQPAYGVYVENGELVMNNNVTIQNAGDSGVRINGGTFNMEGGTISGNTASNGGGVYVNMDCTFNMKGGTITENNFPAGTTNGQGKGVYVASPSDFTMGGSARITDDNDVYLNVNASNPENLFIKINSPLTNTDTVATITPLNYGNNNIKVLEAESGVELSKEHSKFAVTPNGGTKYTINSSGILQVAN